MKTNRVRCIAQQCVFNIQRELTREEMGIPSLGNCCVQEIQRNMLLLIATAGNIISLES